MKYKLLKVPTRFSVVGGTEASRERTAGKAGEPASGRPSVPSDSLPLLCSAVIKGLSVVRWIPGILWACAVVCSPAPRTPHVRKFEARGRACRVIFKPGLHLITVSLRLRLGEKENSTGNPCFKIVSFNWSSRRRKARLGS